MTELRNLRQYIYSLYLMLLKEHIKAQTLTPTQKEQDSVKAFCVLTHAAIEEYFETITLKTVKGAYKKYKSKIYIDSIPSTQTEIDEINLNIFKLLKTLILSSSYSIYSKNGSETLRKHRSKLERVNEISRSSGVLTSSDLADLTVTSDTYAKEILKETTKFFESYIKENHGASLKYILKLLPPTGLDIPPSLLLNSLQKLAEYRGNFAHTRGVSQLLSAPDAVVYIVDTIKICTQIDKNNYLFHKYIT